jgi:hypothetical protein
VQPDQGFELVADVEAREDSETEAQPKRRRK